MTPPDIQLVRDVYLGIGLFFAMWGMWCAAKDDGRGVMHMNAIQMVVLWVYLIVRG